MTIINWNRIKEHEKTRNKMSSNDSIGDRMKKYEDSYRISLPIRMPIIIRLDGKSFSNYTKGLKRPVDQNLIDVMNLTAIELCKSIQGCQLAYIQSDEISLLITNYQNLDTQSWVSNNLQKMVSIAASIAGATFTANSWKIWSVKDKDIEEKYALGGDDSLFPFIKPAYFDARAFVLPKEEVVNCLLWRQLDATRNSIQMLARSLFSHSECSDKNTDQLQTLICQSGINWNDCPTSQKRGRCAIRKILSKEVINRQSDEKEVSMRSEWLIDNDVPIFSQNRDYIEQYIYPKAKEN